MIASIFTIDQVLTDKNLLGAALGDPKPWGTWISILRGAFGLTLDPEQAAAFELLAGGRKPPSQRVRELWVAAGRRSGKSRMAAATAAYLACFGKYRLSKGETGHLLVLALSKLQANT